MKVMKKSTTILLLTSKESRNKTKQYKKAKQLSKQGRYHQLSNKHELAKEHRLSRLKELLLEQTFIS